ncbi:hypothetical protein HPP92_026585 [Vanilla planifolia]|uniref:Uncharacterized protein n=1 Tax=Vanilla planifolia TaxID=51239 RepID=A0A835PD16_VANPL|nr:hypothetical protein HPP92_026585 [Vanilla planifolia]
MIGRVGTIGVVVEEISSKGLCLNVYEIWSKGSIKMARKLFGIFEDGKLGLGINEALSVTPNLSLGSEVFWLGHQRKSGIGFAARYNTNKMVATGQIASTGVVALSYVQKVSEKVSLASDFMYNQMSKDVTASFGYDYILRQDLTDVLGLLGIPGNLLFHIGQGSEPLALCYAHQIVERVMATLLVWLPKPLGPFNAHLEFNLRIIHA